MASPNSAFTEMVSATLRNHPAEIADNVSSHNALFARLRKRGKLKVVGGGFEIVRPLDYAENSTYQRYSGYEQLNVQASDVISSARYDWKQAAVHVTASGLEVRQNSGKERIIDLAAARARNAMRTMANNLSVDLYSLGTADGVEQIGGLQQIITQDGTGTVGGIDASTYTFWKNKFKDLAVGEPAGERVAIIGSGPAGLAAAHDLCLMGFRPVVFEMESVPAGMLYVGVPEYRLPRDVIHAEVALIEALGTEIRCGVEVGKDIGLDAILAEFKAVIIAVGAKNSRKLPIPGIEGPGVLGGVEFLRDVAYDRGADLGHSVVVIGAATLPTTRPGRPSGRARWISPAQPNARAASRTSA